MQSISEKRTFWRSRFIDVAYDPVHEEMIDDMVMTHDIAESLFSPFVKKNAILDRTHLWRNKTVFYYIGNEYTDKHREVIRDGIQLIRDATCVKFVELRHPSQAPGTYVHISSRKGCYARIGSKCKNAVCEMSLEIPGCIHTGTVAHEFLHVLGFFHMQCATGRSNHIRVMFDNIDEKMWGNFEEYATDSTLLGTPYDYESITHYGSMFFSKDKINPSIITRDQTIQKRIGQRKYLSRGDIERVLRLYNCY
ncbi:unnamed protein product [Chironomus riparius]|uniref:Metalloendopeptidase n=1 Tax=Chironomus riparius TaxID=315576 RepID=A0A9P0NRJ1_9DIPT|nr:unnamed protein product [Chironomus riparius]